MASSPHCDYPVRWSCCARAASFNLLLPFPAEVAYGATKHVSTAPDWLRLPSLPGVLFFSPTPGNSRFPLPVGSSSSAIRKRPGQQQKDKQQRKSAKHRASPQPILQYFLRFLFDVSVQSIEQGDSRPCSERSGEVARPTTHKKLAGQPASALSFLFSSLLQPALSCKVQSLAWLPVFGARCACRKTCWQVIPSVARPSQVEMQATETQLGRLMGSLQADVVPQNRRQAIVADASRQKGKKKRRREKKKRKEGKKPRHLQVIGENIKVKNREPR